MTWPDWKPDCYKHDVFLKTDNNTVGQFPWKKMEDSNVGLVQ